MLGVLPRTLWKNYENCVEFLENPSSQGWGFPDWPTFKQLISIRTRMGNQMCHSPLPTSFLRVILTEFRIRGLWSRILDFSHHSMLLPASEVEKRKPTFFPNLLNLGFWVWWEVCWLDAIVRDPEGRNVVSHLPATVAAELKAGGTWVCRGNSRTQFSVTSFEVWEVVVPTAIVEATESSCYLDS